MAIPFSCRTLFFELIRLLEKPSFASAESSGFLANRNSTFCFASMLDPGVSVRYAWAHFSSLFFSSFSSFSWVSPLAAPACCGGASIVVFVSTLN